MRRALVVGLALLTAVMSTSPAFSADPTPPVTVTVDDGNDMFEVTAKVVKETTSETITVTPSANSQQIDSGPKIQWRNPKPVYDFNGNVLGVQITQCPNGGIRLQYDVYTDGVLTGTTTHCEGDELPAGAPTPPPGPTLEQIFAAAKNIPVPAATISIQPPGGETLVNLPTVVSTEAREFTFEADVEDVVIVYTATPTTFTWSFGDGTPPLTTTTPGKPWTKGAAMDTLLTHTYANAAKSRPVSLSVAWTATYTKPNGESGPIPGVINKASGPVSLRVLEAEPVLTE